MAILGYGPIARHVIGALTAKGLAPALVIARPGSEARAAGATGLPAIGGTDALPDEVSLVLDCAGHSALVDHGPRLLAAGVDVVSVSAGAMADATVAAALEAAARQGGGRLHLVAGAIGALDALRAAATGGLTRVSYRGRKPPAAWRGSLAESLVELDGLTGPADFFAGTARQAALEFPKNANVAAATAMAGLGFDATEVLLCADPSASVNSHEIHAEGGFGQFDFRIEGRPLPGSPGSSSLAAMSMVEAVLARHRLIL